MRASASANGRPPPVARWAGRAASPGVVGPGTTCQNAPPMRVLAIVPAYNEARSLPAVVGGLLQGGACDVCVVDDGSTDATAQIASGLGAVVLRCSFNLGIGGAVQAGYLWARDHGYEVAVQVDGDGQHDPAQLHALIEPVLA